jgi:hypothetical protein
MIVSPLDWRVTTRRGGRQSRRPSGGPPFTPASLPGLVAWYRSDLGITLNGSTVSAWADQSGNGHHLTQGTGAQQPTYQASDAGWNGRPSLLSTINTSSLGTGIFSQAQPVTIYFVSNMSTASANQTPINGTGSYLIQWTGSAWLIHSNTSLTSPASSNTTGIMAFVFNSTSSAVYRNSSASPIVTGDAGAIGQNAALFALADNSSGLLAMGGTVVELAYYSGAHSSSQISKVFRYAGSLYGQAWS